MENKVVLVTGATSGIGRATAERFGAAGAKVVVSGRNHERGNDVVDTIKALGSECIFIPADMGKLADIKSLIEQTVEYFGRLDAAVNNAGTAEGASKPITDFDEAEFDAVISVNLKGVWGCMKYQIAQMLQQEPVSGAIVNVSSVNGLGGSRNGALYSASKSGVLALTKSAAQEFGLNGIRINALAAGGFETPMLEGVIRKNVGDDPDAIASAKAGFANAVPVKRIGNPKEAADAIFWLCSDEASYVTGHSMIVDGGLTAYAR